MMYAKFIGSDQTFYRLERDYRQYKSLGKRRVLAWTAQTKNVFGDVPLTQYALTGTPFDPVSYTHLYGSLHILRYGKVRTHTEEEREYHVVHKERADE